MLTRYVIIVIAVVMGLMGLSVFILKKENDKLNTQVGNLQATVREFTSLMQQKDVDLKLCSDRTKQLKEESDKRASAAEIQRNLARIAGQTNRKLADQLLKEQNKSGESDCTAADRIFNDYLDGRGQ